MGRNSLLKRLEAQTGDPKLAFEILLNRGHIDEDGNLTDAGIKRDQMTAEERAIDRQARATGKSPSSFKYNPRTNRATLKRRRQKRRG